MRLLPSWLRKDESRTIMASDYWGGWARGDSDLAGPGLSTLAGPTLNRESALSLAAVWACVSLIADALASMPLEAFTKRQDTATPVPLAPTPIWLLEPNREQTQYEWIFQQLVSLLLDGTTYVYTPRDEAGRVQEAWVVDPRVVIPRRELIGGRQQLIYYVYPQHAVGPIAVTPPDNFKNRVRLGPRDMFHITAFSVPGWLKGLPPLEVARNMLGGAIAAQEMGARFYGQGMNAAGVIEVPEGVTDAQAKQLKEDFRNRNTGLRNMHIPPVLTGGAQWKTLTISPEQAQFLESRHFSVAEIARWFRVMPHMIGEVEKSTSWGSGIEQQGRGFVAYTLRPWIARIEQAYNRHMFEFTDPSHVKFDTSDLTRGDLTAQTNYWAMGRQWGWLNADEIRAEQGRPPVADEKDSGKDYWVPLNMQDVSKPLPPTPSGPQPAPHVEKPITEGQ